MAIDLIVAVSKNNVIGYKGKLPWNLPEDLLHFKQITMGGYLIMGRKTFESIGKVLPGRTSIVLSKEKKTISQCLVAHSLQEAISLCDRELNIFIIGGAQVFYEALSNQIVQKIYLTKIHQEYKGDVFFPKIDNNIYQVSLVKKHSTHSFIVYQKK